MASLLFCVGKRCTWASLFPAWKMTKERGRRTKLPSVSTCWPSNQCWAFLELTAHTRRKTVFHLSQGKPVSLIHHRKRKRKHFSRKWSGKCLCLGCLFSVSSDHKWFRHRARTHKWFRHRARAQHGLSDRLGSRSSGRLAWCLETQPGQDPYSLRLQYDWLTHIPSRIPSSEPQQSDPPDASSIAGMHL